MAKHTPGPWKRIKSDPWDKIQVAPFRYIRVEGRSQAEAEANIPLVLASPDLLEACKEALTVVNPDGYSKTRQFIVDAITKAEGICQD